MLPCVLVVNTSIIQCIQELRHETIKCCKHRASPLLFGTVNCMWLGESPEGWNHIMSYLTCMQGMGGFYIGLGLQTVRLQGSQHEKRSTNSQTARENLDWVTNSAAIPWVWFRHLARKLGFIETCNVFSLTAFMPSLLLHCIAMLWYVVNQCTWITARTVPNILLFRGHLENSNWATKARNLKQSCAPHSVDVSWIWDYTHSWI